MRRAISCQFFSPPPLLPPPPADRHTRRIKDLRPRSCCEHRIEVCAFWRVQWTSKTSQIRERHLSDNEKWESNQENTGLAAKDFRGQPSDLNQNGYGMQLFHTISSEQLVLYGITSYSKNLQWDNETRASLKSHVCLQRFERKCIVFDSACRIANCMRYMVGLIYRSTRTGSSQSDTLSDELQTSCAGHVRVTNLYGITSYIETYKGINK